MGKTQIPYQYESQAVAFEETDFDPTIRTSMLSLVPSDELLSSWKYLYLKRMFDVMGALAMLVIFAVPGLLIGLAIALTSPGTIFYRETRIGRGGRRFRIWKFRSMSNRIGRRSRLEAVPDLEVVTRWRVHKDIPDPRITTVGRFLRRWSLDELPQILNVLVGDMSLIGPRPVIEAEVALYGNLCRYYLAATPGLSGLWQVSGRSDVSFRDRASLDARYVRDWNLLSDFTIFLRTIPAVLGRVGAR